MPLKIVINKIEYLEKKIEELKTWYSENVTDYQDSITANNLLIESINAQITYMKNNHGQQKAIAELEQKKTEYQQQNQKIITIFKTKLETLFLDTAQLINEENFEKTINFWQQEKSNQTNTFTEFKNRVINFIDHFIKFNNSHLFSEKYKKNIAAIQSLSNKINDQQQQLIINKCGQHLENLLKKKPQHKTVDFFIEVKPYVKPVNKCLEDYQYEYELAINTKIPEIITKLEKLKKQSEELLLTMARDNKQLPNPINLAKIIKKDNTKIQEIIKCSEIIKTTTDYNKLNDGKNSNKNMPRPFPINLNEINVIDQTTTISKTLALTS